MIEPQSEVIALDNVVREHLSTPRLATEQEPSAIATHDCNYLLLARVDLVVHAIDRIAITIKQWDQIKFV